MQASLSLSNHLGGMPSPVTVISYIVKIFAEDVSVAKSSSNRGVGNGRINEGEK